MGWKDTTSHSQNETTEQRAEIRSATFDFGPIRILVHRHKDGAPTDWFVSTVPPFIERKRIGNGALGPAQACAIRVVRTVLSSMVTAIDTALDRSVSP